MTGDAVLTDLQARMREMWGDPAIEIASIKPFGGGHSGYTFVVALSDGRGPYVLRLSPPGARIAGPADIGRQARIMSALREAGLPSPEVYASSTGPEIDGRSFAVIELIDGIPWEAAAAQVPHETLAASAIATLKRVQSLPTSETGIGEEEPFSPRDELERWAKLLSRAPFVEERGQVLRAKLAQTCPEPSSPRLVHGDYHYGNLLFDADGAVVALLDWEIAEIGEPMIDLGCLAVASLRRKYPEEPNPAGDLDVSVEHLFSLYGSRDHSDWFTSLACFKYGAILGYNYELHRTGKRPDPVYDELTETMNGLMEDGIEIVAHGLGSVMQPTTRHV